MSLLRSGLFQNCQWLSVTGIRSWLYLGFALGLQLVFAVLEALVVEAWVFCERADVLHPHPLGEGAADAQALVHHFTLR